MHFENAKREQLTTKEGAPVYKIKYPKYKRGKHSIQLVKPKQTCGKAFKKKKKIE